MAWTDLASNQTISFNNLQSAVNIGLFQLYNSIPVSSEQITKSDASYYVAVNTSYTPFANKASNQLVVRDDMQPAFQNSTTFYYDYSFDKEYYYGWVGESAACSGYTSGGTTTIYWNGTLVSFASVYLPIYVNPTYYYIVIIAGTPNWITLTYDQYIYGAGYRYVVTETSACAPTSYAWDATYGTNFFNVCFELPQTVYTSTPTIGVGITVYINSSLTTALGSADYISFTAGGLIWTINGSGVITGDTGSAC